MRRIRPPQGEEVTIELDGEAIPAREGEPVAAALLAAGEKVFSRSIKYHRPRGPFCMSAACCHCLMRVDGVPDVHTCRTPVRAGMRLERQNAYPTAKVDVFESIDWLFPRGLDYHQMFAGVPVAQKVMLQVARHLAGLGVLPEKAVGQHLACETLRVPVAVVGGGAAGSAAAQALHEGGAPFVLFEREEVLGGRLVSAAPDPGAPEAPDPEAWRGSVRLRAPVIGLYDDAEGRYLAATQDGPEGPRLVKCYAEKFLVATGTHAAMVPFEGNDLPGVFAARAAALLLRRQGLLVGDALALVGWGPDLYSTAKLAEEGGARVAALVDMRRKPEAAGDVAFQGEPLRAHGRSHVTALTFRPEGGRARKVSCDAILVAAPPSPAFELARQGGARVAFSQEHEVFVVEAGPDGKTHASDLWVAGELAGPRSSRESGESGRRAARSLLGKAA